MFEPVVDWWEPIIRVCILYVFLLVLVRVSGKRELGQLAPMDLLTMLLISETVSPALTAGDESVTTAVIASGTLVVLTIAMAFATYFSHTFERLTEGTPRELARDGRIDRGAMRAERVTEQDLATALRKNGIEAIDEVELATVEPDGEITFLKKS